MKNIIWGIIFFLPLISSANANEESIKDFAYDLQKLFSIEAKRTLEVADVTHFAPQLYPSDIAEASYNPVINTIFLKRENLISKGKLTYYVKSITALKNDQPLAYPVKISTIFHELGHSEMDQFILRGATSEDRILVNIYKNEFTPWVKRNYPGVNPKTLFHEIYGYYRGNVIETLFADKLNIESLNGFNIFQLKCFKSNYLKRVVGTLSREEFSQLLYPENEPTWEEKYRDRFMPRYVFIRGKDIDLMKNVNDPFKEVWKKAFWYQFSVNYRAPSNMRELALHLRAHHEHLNLISNCRTKMWDEFHFRN